MHRPVVFERYLPSLATAEGLVRFLTEHLGKPIPSPALLGQITQSWVESVKSLAWQQEIPLESGTADDTLGSARLPPGTGSL